MAVGGIYNESGPLTIIDSTFTGNVGIAIGGPAALRNTIVAGIPQNCSDQITDSGHNLDDGTSCGFSAANGSLNSTPPQLDPAGLRDNGGPTQTVAPCAAVGVPAGCTAVSLAIDAGDDAVTGPPLNLTTDQRGRPRKVGLHVDIGAYESAPISCAGDCDDHGTVTIDELLTLVNIALGNASVSACGAGDRNADLRITIDEILAAVHNALNGCGADTAP